MENKKEEFVKEITNIEENFAQWYTDVVIKAELLYHIPSTLAGNGVTSTQIPLSLAANPPLMFGQISVAVLLSFQ